MRCENLPEQSKIRRSLVGQKRSVELPNLLPGSCHWITLHGSGRRVLWSALEGAPVRIVVTAVWLLYAAFFAAMGHLAYVDDRHLDYPPVFLAASAGSFVLGTIGIVLYGIGVRSRGVVAVWKWVVFFILAVMIAGLAMDAVLPRDFNLSNAGWRWVLNASFNVALVAPGYIANWLLWKGKRA